MRHIIKIGAIAAGTTAGVIAGAFMSGGRKLKITDTILDQLKVGKDALQTTTESFKDAVKSVTGGNEVPFEKNLTSLVDKAADTSDNMIAVLEKKLSELKAASKEEVDQKQAATVNKESTADDVVIKAANSKPTDIL